MIVKNLFITKIALTSINHRTKNFDLEVKFVNEIPFRKRYTLSFVNSLPDVILKDIIKEKTPRMEESDYILDNICLVNIKNDEDHIRECLLKFLVRMDQRLKNFAHAKEAKSYMKEYNSLSTYQEIIYQRDQKDIS